jgi:hypothetical protein
VASRTPRAVLLDPLGPGSRRYRTAVFDHRGDVPVESSPCLAPAGAVLLYDGVFLLYRADAAPEAYADVVIDNTDPARPRVTKWPARARETS